MNLPDPARYGLHKLLVAAERGAKHPKYNKNILQALALIQWHLERAPHAIIDAWNDLVSRGPGWSKRARASLYHAPSALKPLAQRFLQTVKG